ncbi:MAG TPA: adenylate/guanylate cyclase domain-containing protein [Candidatus Ozemobacteraceae bacterium]|nr:adenylate/guanylate cyclase domain-containing protein [Candidatus Ozemobacteraceae bacterium]
MLRTEVPKRELVSPLRRYASLLRIIVFALWAVGAVLLLKLRFTGTFGTLPLRSKLVGLLSIAVGLPLVLFLLAALSYGRFSEILGRQERMNKLRQHLERLEQSVQTGSTLFQKRLFEMRDDISRTLGPDEDSIRKAIERLGRIGIYDFAYYIDNRGRVLQLSLDGREVVYGIVRKSKVAQFLHPTAVAMLKVRGNVPPESADCLAKAQAPSTAGLAFLRSITQDSMNDFVTTEGKTWDAAMPDLGTQRFQILFPYRYTPRAREDSLIMLLGRPEQEAAASFDLLFGRSPAAFREMDGEYETRLALYQIDKGIVPTLQQNICWPETARSDTVLSSLARRAFENGWTGAVSLRDGSIEAARLFTNSPFIAVGFATPRGALAGNALQFLFWLLSAYTLTLLCLTTYFLSRLFERPLDALITAVKRLGQGELGLAVSIRSADELGVIGDEITRMSRGLRERNRLRRFVSELAADAAKTGEEAGRRVNLTILFSHIREFTRLSEGLGPTGTVDLLNGYYAAMEEAVHSHGGAIDKFIGDAVMAVFHPDRTGGTHAAAACHAALEMRRALERFNQARAASGAPPLRTGIGIASGIVISGRVGSTIRRQDFTVIGDTVNLAARLESLADSGPFGPILLNDAAASEAGPEFLTIATGRLTVKGKTEPVTVFRLESGDEA